MANSRFRVFAIWFGGKKVAEMTTNSTDIESGDEPQYGTDELLGFSDGLISSKIECDCVIPVRGTQIDFLGVLLNKQDVKVTEFVNGKLLTWDPVRVTSNNYSSESRSGRATGKFVFMAGQPKVAGI